MKDTVQLIPVGHPTGMEWQMSMNGGAPKGQGQYPEIHVKATDTSDMTFSIDHPGSITFANTDAFCAQAGTVKPTKASECGGPFTFTGGGTTKLVVHDANSDQTATTYSYVINFNYAKPLDPIIKNGGCCTSNNVKFTSATVAEIAAVVIVLAVIAFFVWRRMAYSGAE